MAGNTKTTTNLVNVPESLVKFKFQLPIQTGFPHNKSVQSGLGERMVNARIQKFKKKNRTQVNKKQFNKPVSTISCSSNYS